MANVLDKVKTVVLLMFENRSFDHMLGHLSFEKINNDVDGLKSPLSNFNNIYKGDTYNAYSMKGDTQLAVDLPHEFNEIDIQLAKSGVTGKFTMSGFVESYAEKTGLPPNTQCQPMGFFKSTQAPVSSFLANSFCVCDRWFTPIPTSTQPNKTMAFFGDTKNHATRPALINMDDSIFDWMTKAGIRWRVYHDGLSFFVLYPRLWHYIFGSNFRRYSNLASDILNEPEETAPQVIIIEPAYQDSPHIGSSGRPNDNHAPLAIGWGEELLRNTYRALTGNTKKWESTVMITYYDEHGGFYDHVPPPAISYQTKADTPFTFASLGPRVPAIIASPFVKPGTVCHSLFDHTSVLHFLSEKFAPGNHVSETVKSRHEQGIASISEALNNDVPWAPPQPPTTPIFVQTALGATIQTAPESEGAQSFEIAANEIIEQLPDDTKRVYPELFLWKEAVSKARVPLP
ncbi:MAG: alkaline phosphatase family protein [Ferruginibacter sp.]